MLSFLSKVAPEDVTRIFSVINSYLPIVTAEVLTPELEEYLKYLLEVTLDSRSACKAIPHIFFKIARSGRPSLIEGVTRNLVQYLSEGLIK